MYMYSTDVYIHLFCFLTFFFSLFFNTLSLSLSLSVPPSIATHHATSEPPLTLTCIFTGSYGNVNWYREDQPIPTNTSTDIIVETYPIGGLFPTYYTQLQFTDTIRDMGQYMGEYYCGFEALVVDELPEHNKYEGTTLYIVHYYINSYCYSIP